MLLLTFLSSTIVTDLKLNLSDFCCCDSELISKESKQLFWEFTDAWLGSDGDDSDCKSARDCLLKISKQASTLLAQPVASLFHFSLTLRSASPRLALYRQLADESLSSFPHGDDPSATGCCWVDTGSSLFYDVADLQSWLASAPAYALTLSLLFVLFWLRSQFVFISKMHFVGCQCWRCCSGA